MKKAKYKIVFSVSTRTIEEVFGKDFFINDGTQLSFDF